MSRDLRRAPIAFACGATFAVGLTIAGMERPMAVLDAFTVSPSFDPRLPILLVSSLAVHAPLAAWIRRRRAIRVEQGRIDRPLVLGAVLFGIGWGLGGVCPGPAFTGALTGAYPFTFLVGFVLAIVVHHVARERIDHQPSFTER